MPLDYPHPDANLLLFGSPLRANCDRSTPRFDLLRKSVPKPPAWRKPWMARHPDGPEIALWMAVLRQAARDLHDDDHAGVETGEGRVVACPQKDTDKVRDRGKTALTDGSLTTWPARTGVQ